MNEFCLSVEEVRKRAVAARRSVLEMNSRAKMGHTGADLSETDILCSLYFHIMDTARSRLDDPDRDRFVLSKGHGVAGLYATLAEAGYFEKQLLETYLAFDSRLPGHPVRGKTPGIEISTGALGHGLSVGVGLALGAKRTGRAFRVFVLTGDGELQEGSNWEAMMSAAHFKLDNLVLIIDRNGLQLADRTERIMALEPLDRKLESFGWDVHRADGNDPGSLIATVDSLDFGSGTPHAILANTTKGKGISFIEDQAAWHHKVPTPEQLTLALEELA
jgi:transketolase